MEEKIRNSKSIIGVGIFATIIFFLMLLTSFPLIGQLIVLVLPTAMALLYLKYNLKSFIFSIFIVGGLISIFTDPIYGIGLTITNGIISIALVYCVKNKISSVRSLLYVVISNIIGLILELGLMFSVLTGITFHQYIDEMVKVFNEAANMSEQMVAGTQANAQMLEYMKSIDSNFIITAIPVIIIIYIIIKSFLNYIIGTIFINRFGFKLEYLPPFSKWYFNPVLIAGVFVINIVNIYLVKKGFINNKGIYYATIALLLIMFSVQGLAVISNLLKYKLKLNNVLIVFFSILLVSSMNIFLALLGIVDVLLDTRGVDPNSLGSYIKEKLKKKVQ
ncbi:DUF2232 domain-containing protein [Clostridium perfringens]|nr:DUF2232 domain-containing protein [Clostridium perfringens]MDK0711915.1 DUF2232 domain-containing protein [Clostridium perfringens]